MLLVIIQIKQSGRKGRSTRVSLASLSPGVLRTCCKTELFLGLVSAPRHLCTTAANMSRAARLYVRQEFAQAGVKPAGQPFPFTAELGLQAVALLLTLEPQGRVSSALLLAARLPLLLSHLLRRPLSHSTELGAPGQPPLDSGLCFLAGTQSYSPVTRPKLPPACRACSAWGTT